MDADKKCNNVKRLAEIIQKIKSEECQVLDRDEFEDERDRALLESVIIKS